VPKTLQNLRVRHYSGNMQAPRTQGGLDMNKKPGLLLVLLAMPAHAETDAQVQAVQMPA